MTTKPEPHPALDATMSAPGVTPRRSGDAARPAATPADAGAPADPSVRSADRIDGEELQPGDTLGRYVIGERIGAGGMGFVFRARDPDLGREVAIKVLRTGGEGSGGALERRLLREAQAMATLSHDNLASVYDIGVGNGRVFVAMELVDGGTLRALFADPARSWRDKLAAVIAAGRGLAAAHSAGVIHRDFKPDNVLLARSGRVKVVDFGLARAEPDGSAGPGAGDGARPAALPADLSANLTQTGALLGTPAYMAPEQHAGHPVDARADQFSFAVTAWEAVYGRRPFPSEAYSSLVAAVRAQELIPPPRGAGVPPALEAVLRRALSLEPRDRYTSIDALLAAIDAAIHPRHRGRWLAAAAALGLIAAGAVTGYVVTRGRGSSPAPAVAAGSAAAPPPTATVRTVRVPTPPVARSARPGRTTVRVAALDFADMARVAAADDGKGREAVVLTRMAQARVVHDHEDEAIACYDDAGVRHAGTIVVELELDPAGKVRAARALEDGLGAEVARCLLARIRGWRFPASPDGEASTVRFPFRFSPPAAAGAAAEDEGGVRIELPPLPGLPDGLEIPLPDLDDVPVPPTPPVPPAAPAAAAPPPAAPSPAPAAPAGR